MSLFDEQLANGRRWVRIGDMYNVTRKPRGLDMSTPRDVPFAAMDAIPQDGSYLPTFTLRPGHTIVSGTYFERGDILVGKITPSFENGKQALISELQTPFGFATTEVIPLHPRSREHDPRFLFYFLLHPDVRHYVAERMEGSTGRQRVPEGVLLNTPTPEFAIHDQQAIAATLECIKKAAIAESNSERKTARLKHAAAALLFSRGLRGESLSETQIGRLPMSWNVVSFGTIRERLQYGTSTRCTYEHTRYPVLRIPNVDSGRVNVADLKFADFTAAEAAAYRLDEGDLLFVRTNGVIERLGNCAVYFDRPADALFASYLIRARLRRELIEPVFAAQFLCSEVGTAMIASRATPAADGKYNLNTGTIDSLLIPLPPTLDEQREIVAILDAIDLKIDLHRRKRAVLDELFTALLHKLMTGEIRVADLDLSALEPAPSPPSPPSEAG